MCWDFGWNCTDSTDQFGENWHLNNIEFWLMNTIYCGSFVSIYFPFIYCGSFVSLIMFLGFQHTDLAHVLLDFFFLMHCQFLWWYYTGNHVFCDYTVLFIFEKFIHLLFLFLDLFIEPTRTLCIVLNLSGEGGYIYLVSVINISI